MSTERIFHFRKTDKFHHVSIILPVMDETHSLTKTISLLEEINAKEILEYILVISAKSSPGSLTICENYQCRDTKRFILHKQSLPFLGGAMREAFCLCRGTHTILMASDLETDPLTVSKLINQAKSYPLAIITASRWLKGGGFTGYSFIKLFLNRLFQKFFSILYKINLTDMTYGFRLFPTELVQAIRWEELRHPFLFETLVKPLRLGIRVHEVSSPWKAREEGMSQNTFLRNFSYLKTGLKTRFCSIDRILL